MQADTENTLTRSEMQQYVSQAIESRLQKAMEDFVERNELRLKELSVIERVIRVEEELKALREMSTEKFASLQREMDSKFEALLREMNARFEAMDKRFSVVQWMIGIFVGIPGLIIALSKVLEILK